MYSTFHSLKKLRSIQNPTLFSQTVNTTAEEEIKIHRAAVATWKTKLEGARAWRAEAAVLPKTELSNSKPLLFLETVAQLNTNHTRSQHHCTGAQMDRFCSGFLQIKLKIKAGNLKNT